MVIKTKKLKFKKTKSNRKNYKTMKGGTSKKWFRFGKKNNRS